jgi:hypothetical protein
LKKYGNLLNHDAKHPNNPLSIQKKQVQEMKLNSIYRSGTIFQMKGNTIHAGPPSDRRNCRVIFFYAASPTPITSLYEPDNQWNQVTLVSAFHVDIWRHIPSIERAVILEYIQCIQSDETIAPSDTCLFVMNFTLRLFIRISLFLPSPHASNIAFQWKYVNFLHQLCNKDDISPAH